MSSIYISVEISVLLGFPHMIPNNFWGCLSSPFQEERESSVGMYPKLHFGGFCPLLLHSGSSVAAATYHFHLLLLQTVIFTPIFAWTMKEEEKVQLQLPPPISERERQHVFSHKMLLHLFRGGKIRNGKSLNNYRGGGKFKLAPTLFSHNRAEKRKGFF